MKFNQSLSLGATAFLATLLAVSGAPEIGNANPSLNRNGATIQTASLAIDSGRADSATASLLHRSSQSMKSDC
jgi:hypothetical protein